jgi:hypothetical protein
MNGTQAIAWSRDAKFIAIASPTELLVIRIEDATVVSHAFVFTDYGGKPRFGDQIAFSTDDSRLIIESPNNDEHILLYSFIIASKKLEPLLVSPLQGREHDKILGSGRLYNQLNRLFYSAVVMRHKEAIITPEREALPKTGFVFEVNSVGRALFRH